MAAATALALSASSSLLRLLIVTNYTCVNDSLIVSHTVTHSVLPKLLPALPLPTGQLTESGWALPHICHTLPTPMSTRPSKM